MNNDEIEGDGKMMYKKSGNIYEGEWKEGKKTVKVHIYL